MNCNSVRLDTVDRVEIVLGLLAVRLEHWQRAVAQQREGLATACVPKQSSSFAAPPQQMRRSVFACRAAVDNWC